MNEYLEKEFYNNLTCWGNNANGQTSIPAVLHNTHTYYASVGNAFTCALYNKLFDKSYYYSYIGLNVVCFGTGVQGDIDTMINIGEYPSYINGIVIYISAGYNHVCSVVSVNYRFNDKDNSLVCWGSNSHGQVTTNFENISYLKSGNNLSCVISVENRIECFGDVKYIYPLPPTLVNQPSLQIGYDFACGLEEDGYLCWGNNGSGIDLGDLSQELKSKYDSNVRLALYYKHMCVYKGGADMQCYGVNTFFQANIPTHIPKVKNSKDELAPGGHYTCSTTNKMNVFCWGSMNGNDLSENESRYNITQIPDKIHHRVNLVSAGGNYTCLMRGGKTCCIGSKNDGEIVIPHEYSYGLKITTGYSHMCILVEYTNIKCYTYSSSKQDDLVLIPDESEYASSHSVFRLAAGYKFTCILVNKNPGVVTYCWGINTQGQTDIPYAGTEAPSGNPVTTNSIITAGVGHVCLTLCDRQFEVVCWGLNESGQTVPPHIPDVGLTASGYYHNCHWSEYNIMCWGNNGNGQVEVPQVLQDEFVWDLADVPRLVLDELVQQVACGGLHSCAVWGVANQVLCWGSNKRKQVKVPAPYIEFRVAEVTLGNYHTCVMFDGGDAKCWGDASNGQLNVELPEMLSYQQMNI